METTDLLGDFASGDAVPASEAPPSQTLKRDQDSTDDFEHLEREGKKDEFGESPSHQHGTARAATQNFLEMERDEFVDTPRAPSVTDKLADHIADKFTDSESEADTAGESPLHRPKPPVHVDTAPAAEVTKQEPRAQPDPAPLQAAEPATTAAPPPTPAPFVHSLPPELSETGIEARVEPATPAAEAPHKAPSQPAAPATAAPATESKPESVRAPTAHVIEAEVIFCQMGLVEALIYWRCAARSGAALGGGLALLVALASCSVVSVLAYAALLALAAALALRIYRNVLQAVQKTNDGHPFKWLLEKDISLPAERAQALAAAGTAHLNAAAHELRRLFLVEDLVDSLKFGVLLWCLTYVGACFNGITLIILGWIALFTLPKAYEMNKAQVDANLELARAKINEISAKVRAAVPLGRKADADKDK
ncbi:PREDICTED: reticulon-3-like isoform X2 [Papilio xuthus]|uniref:Reticulon-like protein n=1 Tax=Papilio xuthus TaxID=66420 RepID=A0AAJ6ZTC2_PAPXU|nr:PREDICTED: reticulon-3-like isoform X2 [Papilio xuthus]